MLNKFMGIGNLGADSELRHTQRDAVLNFRIAITKKWKDSNGEKQERTEWVSCVIWGRRAEALAEYLTKGTRVYVEGELRSSKYTDREGVERWKTEVYVEELALLGSPHDDSRRDDRSRDRGDGHRSSGRDRRDDDRRPRGRDDRDDRRSSRDDRGRSRDDRSQSRGGSQRPPRDDDRYADEVFGDDDIPF